MHFPGKDYLVYLEDPTSYDVRFALDAGISRVLFSSRSYPEFRASDSNAFFRSYTAAGRDLEIVRADGDTARRLVFSDGEATTSEHPIWRLGVDEIGLLQLYMDESEFVFIDNCMRVSVYFPKNGDTKIRMRELWECLQDPREAKLVIFGHFIREVNYGFGLDGSASTIRHGLRTRMRDFRGPNSENLRGAASNRELWAGEPSLAGSTYADKPEFAAMRFLIEAPLAFQKAFGELERWDIGHEKVSEVGDKYVDFLAKPGERVNLRFVTGDRRMCDACSVKYACRLYKERSVCIMPGSEGKRLAGFFNTRNADDVINGIGAILEYQANRFEQILESEAEAQKEHVANGKSAKFDPEINKMANDLQRNAERYAKLLNPNLTRPQVAVQVNNGQVTLDRSEITPKMRAAAARELEAGGVSRAEQTPQMILDHIVSVQHGGKVLEGEVVDGVRHDF